MSPHNAHFYCSSDRELLTATVKIKLKNTQTTKKWILDTDNIPEDYKADIQEKLSRLKLDGNAEMAWKVLKDTIIEAADKHIPKKGKEKRTCLDIPRHTEGCGKEAADESGRKVGGSEEAEWRDTKKN